MRIGLAFVVSAAVGFVALDWAAPVQDGPPKPMPVSWVPAPLRPPPLDLPSSTCSRAWVEGDEVPAAWSHEASESFLLERVADAAGVELIDVDCAESPCIAWLLWADGRLDPDRVFRWWSLDDAPGAVLWTQSHTFDTTAVPSATLQAIAIAPWPGSAPEVGLDRVASRVASTRPLVERVLSAPER